MHDRALYQQILGITAPFFVSDVSLDAATRRITVRIQHAKETRPCCPECGASCPIHDHQTRQWRHLDTCQFQTILEADLPRVKCPDHGIHQIPVPWAERNGRFTALFECLVIDWIKAAKNRKAAAELLGITWDEADGVMRRAVERGLARREDAPVPHLSVDETSFQKRHEYVTVICDRQNNRVIEVLDDRKKESFVGWLKGLPAKALEAVQTVTMDMWPAFIRAILQVVPGGEGKVCFDRFHVSQHMGNGVDKVRRQEHRKMLENGGESVLTKTKYDWLRTSKNIDNRSRRDFMALTKMALKTARAWAMKETAAGLWDYASRTWAEKAWKQLIGWMDRSRLGPMIEVSKMLKEHLWGILNAIEHQATNGAAEGLNSGIQKIKAVANGFRNRRNFRMAILFFFGALDLYPATAAAGLRPRAGHTNS